ncbi:MAG: metallophosphatase family protein [Planctomycetes bacterium]|nr:metallophosphatase family protein [Planctomycetota bacterium]
MRILIVSDIHANWQALEAVRESFDLCLFLGDLVDYGLEPGPCIEWVRVNATHSVRGNHDHGASQRVVINGLNGFRYLSGVTRMLTFTKLGEPDRRFLAGMPITKYLTINGKRILMVHATPREPMDEFGPPDVDFWRSRLEGIDVDYVLCGHTHHPYILNIGRTTIINPGSVGLPRDGDPRASYAIMTDQGAELRRVEYPFEKTIETIQASTLPDRAKEMLAEVYRHGRLITGRGNGIGK